MIRAFRVAERDLRRRARDPIGLLLWVAIPLAIAVLVRLAFGGSAEGPPRARLALADLDQTLISRFVDGGFRQGPAAALFEVQTADSARAVDLAKAGKVSAALIISRGFADGFLNHRSVELVLYKNPSERVLPTIIEETVLILADAGFYIREILGAPIDRVMATQRGPSDLEVSELSVEISQIARRARPFLFPPILSLQVVQPERKGEADDYFTLLFPGLLVMSVLFVSQALAQDLWVERRRGTFRRNLTTGVGMGTLVLGKILAGITILGLILVVVMGLGRFAFQLELANAPQALIFAIAGSFGILCGLHVVTLLARTEAASTVLTSFIIMPLILTGGSFFPVEWQPPGLRWIALHTPNGWMRGILKDLFLEADTGAWLPGTFICLAAGLVLLSLADRLARRRMAGA
ncbi:MAG: ABC transporter permease [Candidatus Eisenbacteria bacterium]|nr:ABC transporter permease [Candidatus Eisenbacteria bacterium]